MINQGMDWDTEIGTSTLFLRQTLSSWNRVSWFSHVLLIYRTCCAMPEKKCAGNWKTSTFHQFSTFSRRRSKDSRFTLECGGWAVFARRFATVRNRPREDHRPCLSFCKKVTFWAVQRRIASFCVASEFNKVVLHMCGRRSTFAAFSEMRYIFRRKRSTLETSHVILRGTRSTLDVSCCCLLATRIVSAARSGDKVQIP